LSRVNLGTDRSRLAGQKRLKLAGETIGQVCEPGTYIPSRIIPEGLTAPDEGVER
jgi:hypothetical protein